MYCMCTHHCKFEPGLCLEPKQCKTSCMTALSAGQFGALLRWQLARFNARLPGCLHWFPAGTFAANMLACAFIFACQAVLNTQTAYWWLVLGAAIEKGVCGGLSTVSTLVNEVRTCCGTAVGRGRSMGKHNPFTLRSL